MSDDTPRIDFYVLDEDSAAARRRFACRLAEKAFGLNTRVHALTADANAARELDELLWTFRAGSFVPHVVDQSADNENNPVTIGFGDGGELSGELLINLTDEVPVCFDRFERIAEIVDGRDDCRQAGRTRFSFYRENGYAPTTHKIT